MPKFDDTDILVMRVMRAVDLWSLKEIGKAFEISDSAVHLVTTGKTYKSAPGPVTKAATPTDLIILFIRGDRADGMTYLELGKKYRMCEVTLRGICTGKTYAGAGGPITPARAYKRRT